MYYDASILPIRLCLVSLAVVVKKRRKDGIEDLLGKLLLNLFLPITISIISG